MLFVFDIVHFTEAWYMLSEFCRSSVCENGWMSNFFLFFYFMVHSYSGFLFNKICAKDCSADP